MVGIYFVLSRLHARYLICVGVTILKGLKKKFVRNVAREATTNLKYSYMTK